MGAQWIAVSPWRCRIGGAATWPCCVQNVLRRIVTLAGKCCRPENASRVDEAVGGSGAPAQKSVEVCDSMARLAPSYSRVARRGLVCAAWRPLAGHLREIGKPCGIGRSIALADWLDNIQCWLQYTITLSDIVASFLHAGRDFSHSFTSCSSAIWPLRYIPCSSKLRVSGHKSDHVPV
jgi:hypothetical protein